MPNVVDFSAIKPNSLLLKTHATPARVLARSERSLSIKKKNSSCSSPDLIKGKHP